MFNFETFAHGVSSAGAGPECQGINPSRRATLYVYSPVLVPTQVLRPYQYNFTNNLIDALSSSTSNLSAVVANPDSRQLAEDVHKAVLPDPNGFILDTSVLNGQWSFVLIVDNVENAYGSRTQATGPVFRTITCGYCSEEPIDPLTNTINPNAILTFTKTDTIIIKPMIGNWGLVNQSMLTSDASVVDDRVQQLTSTQLYNGTPYYLTTGAIRDRITNDLIHQPGPASFSNIGKGNGSATISNNLNIPSCVIKDIASSIDTAVDHAKSVGNSSASILLPSSMDDPVDVALDSLETNMPGYNVTTTRGCLDTSLPMSMSQLASTYPEMEVIPSKLPLTNMWSCSPQDRQTKRNMCSSMLSSALPSIAVSFGLLSISFRYDSYTPSSQITSLNNGIFYPMEWSTATECTDKAQADAVNLFRDHFVSNMVPVIRSIGGEFSLHCILDTFGLVLIDLLFLDEVDFNAGEAWYETSGKLAGFLNPAIVDGNSFASNATQLLCLKENVVQGQLCGARSNYGYSPLINSNSMDVQFTGNSMPEQSTLSPQVVNPLPNTQIHQNVSKPVIRNGYY